jgi:hypothetical protein
VNTLGLKQAAEFMPRLKALHLRDSVMISEPDRPTWNVTAGSRIAADLSSSLTLRNDEFEPHRHLNPESSIPLDINLLYYISQLGKNYSTYLFFKYLLITYMYCKCIGNYCGIYEPMKSAKSLTPLRCRASKALHLAHKSVANSLLVEPPTHGSADGFR